MDASGKNMHDSRVKTSQKPWLSLSARIFLLRSLNWSENMSATFENYLYISGPYDDLLKITSELNFVKKFGAEYDWEHDGVSATIHFQSEDGLPFEDIDPAMAKYPSLKLTWRYTHELLEAGLFIYENGKNTKQSIYNWDTGEVINETF